MDVTGKIQGRLTRGSRPQLRFPFAFAPGLPADRGKFWQYFCTLFPALCIFETF